MDLHGWLELLTPVALGILGWVAKTLQHKMHLENQSLLTAIDSKIDKHVAIDDVKHEDFERRLEELEERRRRLKS